MSEGSATLSSRWTKAQVEEFLAKEQPRYQRIELPYGLATRGEDRRPTAEVILPARLDGQSLLDVGCFLGFFCHEALRRGAARAVGVDVDSDRLRQARAIADCLGLPAELQRLDVERDALPGRFDLVLCLNVLHHLYDPLRALDTLLAATKQRLVLEVAGAENPRAQDILWGKGPLRKLLRPTLEQQPVLIAGGGRNERTYGLFYFTPQALLHVLQQRRTVARVDLSPSPYRDRFTAVVWKRRIDRMAFVCGLPGVGKSTTCRRLLAGELPEVRRALGMEAGEEWSFSGARLLPEQSEPHVPRMLFHYDLMRGSPLMKCGFLRDPALDVLGCAERVAAVMLWADPEVLALRLARRPAEAAGEEEHGSRTQERRIRKRLDFLGDPRRVKALLDDWFAFVEARQLALSFVDVTGDPKPVSREEVLRRAAAAGWR